MKKSNIVGAKHASVLKAQPLGVSRDEIEHIISNTNNIMTYIHIYLNNLKQKLQEY